MATESIFRNIFIDTAEDAERFISALEKAEAIADKIPPVKVDYEFLDTPEKIQAFFKEYKFIQFSIFLSDEKIFNKIIYIYYNLLNSIIIFMLLFKFN